MMEQTPLEPIPVPPGGAGAATPEAAAQRALWAAYNRGYNDGYVAGHRARPAPVGPARPMGPMGPMGPIGPTGPTGQPFDFFPGVVNARRR
jgi:hypothetical protein